MHLLEFDTLHTYGTDKESIELSVTLRSGDRIVTFAAQLDTGATFCVFERGYGQTLGLTVESGTPLRFSTAMGSFDAYGHMVSLETLGYSFDVTVYFACRELTIRSSPETIALLHRGLVGQRRYPEITGQAPHQSSPIDCRCFRGMFL